MPNNIKKTNWRSRALPTATALLCAAALMLSGCASGEDNPAASSPPTAAPVSVQSAAAEQRSVTDLSGQTVNVSDVQRIVSLTPSTTSILIEEGAQDRIVGVDASSRGAENVTVCGTYADPDIDTIVSLAPDIVFAGNLVPDDAVDRMKQAGIAVINAEASSFDQVPDSFRLVGTIIGEDAAAEALCEQLASTVAEVEDQRPDTAPSCYYVISFAEDGNWTSGPGSFINTMIEIAGGTCVTANSDGTWIEYSSEDLMAANPDCIIYSSDAGSYGDIVSNPGYEDLEAVANGLVFEIDADIVSQPGPGLNEGLLALSSIISEAAQGPAPTADAAAQETVLTD